MEKLSQNCCRPELTSDVKRHPARPRLSKIPYISNIQAIMKYSIFCISYMERFDDHTALQKFAFNHFKYVSIILSVESVVGVKLQTFIFCKSEILTSCRRINIELLYRDALPNGFIFDDYVLPTQFEAEGSLLPFNVQALLPWRCACAHARVCVFWRRQWWQGGEGVAPLPPTVIKMTTESILVNFGCNSNHYLLSEYQRHMQVQ